jgi:transposase
MTIVETRTITGGVSTPTSTFTSPPRSTRSAVSWGRVLPWIEGTGSYGVGLARHTQAAGVTVIEVKRADRAARRTQGKSDPLDASTSRVVAARDRVAERTRRAC